MRAFDEARKQLRHVSQTQLNDSDADMHARHRRSPLPPLADSFFVDCGERPESNYRVALADLETSPYKHNGMRDRSLQPNSTLANGSTDDTLSRHDTHSRKRVDKPRLRRADQSADDDVL